MSSLRPTFDLTISSAHVISMQVSPDFNLLFMLPTNSLPFLTVQNWDLTFGGYHSRSASPPGLTPCQHTTTWRTAPSTHTWGQRVQQAARVFQHDLNQEFWQGIEVVSLDLLATFGCCSPLWSLHNFPYSADQWQKHNIICAIECYQYLGLSFSASLPP